MRVARNLRRRAVRLRYRAYVPSTCRGRRCLAGQGFLQHLFLVAEFSDHTILDNHDLVHGGNGTGTVGHDDDCRTGLAQSHHGLGQSVKLIGAREFFVRVGPQCSGVEGFALITVFLSLYMGLFWRDLRFPHALLLFPVGLLASWVFNVTRIVILLVIGIEGSPDLAIGGFHSHAGWLAFTLLSIGLIALSRLVPLWSRRVATPQELAPFLADPVVAQILPFIVFMASGLLASTFFADPAQAYPLRALAMAAALALVWPWLRGLTWRLDPIALISGLGIGVAWVVTSPIPEEVVVSPVMGMGGAMAAVWIGTRIIGTTLLVPVIEEVLFRGYLIDRIAPTRQTGAMILAIAVGAVLFAALHDRWLAAGLAGLVFGALVWRSDNLTDAIVSHGAANGLIAAWALATGAWHII